MDEPCETFIRRDEGCDSLQPSSSGLSVGGVLHTERLDDGAWTQGRERSHLTEGFA